jgi:hypothetical protein
MSATPKTIAAAILAVRNLIIPTPSPALLNAFVIGKARTRAGTSLLFFVSVRLSELKVELYKNKGELYFGITWSQIYAVEALRLRFYVG